jgi:hypothetical protein
MKLRVYRKARKAGMEGDKIQKGSQPRTALPSK